jgi:DNA polymerase-3 subunit beta
MQFILEQADLLAGLVTVTRAMAARSTMPVYESVRIDAGEGGLTLTCTDLSIGIETTLSASVKEPGSLLLPGRLFLEIVRKLPSGEVAISSRDFGVTIKAQGSRTHLQGMPAVDFPDLPQIDDAAQIVMEQQKLRDMIRKTTFAAAVEETNATLTGVLLEASGRTATMVALDRFRFALQRGELTQDAPELSAIIPAKYLGEIARMTPDEEGEVALGFGRTHVALQLGRTLITVRLLDGEFVKYRQLIPVEQKVVAKIGRAAFADCIDRAALIARDTKNNLINLQLEDERMIVTSQGENSNFYEELPIVLQGAGLEIAFNVRYVSDAVKCLSDDEISMRFTSPVSPCVVTPVEGDQYLYLLLPVRVFGR